ncbi:forkhead box protein M1-like [Diretmus argenteus]
MDVLDASHSKSTELFYCQNDRRLDGPDPPKVKKESDNQAHGTPVAAEAVKQLVSQRPPYSYTVMIQFAINSTQTRRMTLKQIYTWIEDHFPYFREEAKPGWKNSIRHNLSLHEMFIRETTPNGKLSQWTIGPGANRVLTLDRVDKVTHSHTYAMASYPSATVEVKEEQVCTPVSSETLPAPLTRETSSSRRKQRLVPLSHDEPVLLLVDGIFFDSDVASGASAFQDTDHLQEQESTCREFSFKTPMKSSDHMAFSTPSNVVPEPWWVTPLGKGSRGVLDFSPIRTPGGPAPTLQWNDYTAFSLSSTPFKDLPLFSSPRVPLTSTRSRAVGPNDPLECFQNCPREPLQAGGSTPASRSHPDIMNDSMSNILMDVSFTGLDGENLGVANIDWSECFLCLQSSPI